MATQPPCPTCSKGYVHSLMEEMLTAKVKEKSQLKTKSHNMDAFNYKDKDSQKFPVQKITNRSRQNYQHAENKVIDRQGYSMRNKVPFYEPMDSIKNMKKFIERHQLSQSFKILRTP